MSDPINEERLDDSTRLIEKDFDHSNFAIYVVFLNVGLNFVLYGFQTVLSTYLQLPGLGLSKETAGSVTNAITAIAYVFALFGGFVADTYIGLFKTIITGTVIFFFSTVFLLLATVLGLATVESATAMAVFSSVGIVLFDVGGGMTKACTSAFLGEQFNANQVEKRSRFYSWYYLSIQFGSIFVTLASPIILDQKPWGPWGLFTILAGSFFISLPLFLFRSRFFRKRQPQGSVYSTFIKIVASAIRNRHSRVVGGNSHWLDPAKSEFDEQKVEDVKAVMRVLVVFAPLPFFWGIFFQMYSVWVNQASSMDLNFGGTLLVNGTVCPDGFNATQGFCGGFNMPPATTITLNPLFDIFLIPVFASGLYPLIGKCGINVTPLRKMAAGLVFTVAALVVAGFVEVGIAAAFPTLISIWWIVPQYFLVSVAEVLLSVTVYELAYAEAPSSMKGMVTGVMFITVALGNALLALLQLIKGSRSITNFAFAGGIVLVFVWFLVVSIRYKYRVETEEAK